MELTQNLEAGLYQRSLERMRHTNGFNPITVKKYVGDIQIEVPQVGQGFFYWEALGKRALCNRAAYIDLGRKCVLDVNFACRSDLRTTIR